MIHDLKIRKVFFDAIVNGEKKFEIRNNDRCFSVGDFLLLREIEIDIRGEVYTGNAVLCHVLYVLHNSDFLQPNYVCMSISNLGKFRLNSY